MAQTESHTEAMEKSALPGLTPSDLAAMGLKRMEEFAKVQAELFSTLQETHRHWLDRMQSEARIASELARGVTNARSIPDAVAACQEWTSRRFEMMADDSTHLLAGSHKIMETGARFLSNGLLVNEQCASAVVTEDRPPSRSQAGPAQSGPAHTGPAIVQSRHVGITGSDSANGLRSSGDTVSP
jgi:hypothetical protein